jgi:5-methylcytosine-specific restriction endonuclease McrA
LGWIFEPQFGQIALGFPMPTVRSNYSLHPYATRPTEAQRAAAVANRGSCGICGNPITGQLHLDHVVPISAGGWHEPANVQIAHPSCNARKWAKLDYVPPELPNRA